MADLKTQIRSFVESNFLLDSGMQIGEADSLLQLQIVDSTGFLELVNFLEATFGIRIADDEMVPENLETLQNIEQFVRRKLGS